MSRAPSGSSNVRSLWGVEWGMECTFLLMWQVLCPNVNTDLQVNCVWQHCMKCTLAGSAVCTMTWSRAGQPKNRGSIPSRARNSVFSEAPRRIRENHSAPCSMVTKGFFSPQRLKWPCFRSDHSPSSRADVRNAWSSMTASLYVFWRARKKCLPLLYL